MKLPPSSVWSRLTNFWDNLFLTCESRLRCLWQSVGRSLRTRPPGKRLLLVSAIEELEPRWVLSPVAVPDSYSVLHGHTLTVSSPSLGVLANDYDTGGLPLTASRQSGPSHGTVSLNSDGTFTYTPTTSYAGSDGFTYSISDGTMTASTTVTIEVTDNRPVAGNDSYAVAHNHTLTVSNPLLGLLANASDADSDALTASRYTTPSHGSVTVNTDGTFTYTPTTGYIGSDNFMYSVSDGALSARPPLPST